MHAEFMLLELKLPAFKQHNYMNEPEERMCVLDESVCVSLHSDVICLIGNYNFRLAGY
jgi:hypothetical protein